MKFIQYNVSGEIMEILQFLLSFLLKDFNNLSPILSHLSENGFDLKSAISNLSLDKLAPILSSFFSQKESPTNNNFVGLNPIANIADKEIVYTLNKYFSR